jgi:hypothetical protein
MRKLVDRQGEEENRNDNYKFLNLAEEIEHETPSCSREITEPYPIPSGLSIPD